MCERWVGDWTNCNILTPSSSALAALLSRSAGLLNRGSWGPIALCWVLVLSTASYLQLTEPVCSTGLYNCLTPTCFLWASHLHPIQPVHSQGYNLISSTGCTCYLHRCISYLTIQPRVNMLHNVTSVAITTKLPEWFTVKCYIFIGRTHCISK